MKFYKSKLNNRLYRELNLAELGAGLLMRARLSHSCQDSSTPGFAGHRAQAGRLARGITHWNQRSGVPAQDLTRRGKKEKKWQNSRRKGKSKEFGIIFFLKG